MDEFKRRADEPGIPGELLGAVSPGDRGTAMDAFNKKYKDLVDQAPYSARCPFCERHEVDDTVWQITIERTGSAGQGTIVGTWCKAFFKGPQYATSNGQYQCQLTETIERW